MTGTIYMDMPLKPNILEDITKDHFATPPPPREKYVDNGLDQTMLEDESGRLRLTGAGLARHVLVTGVIVAVLGTETADGNFDVADIQIAGLAAQKPLPAPGARSGRRVALASGLGISGASVEGLDVHLLVEYLLGEAGGADDRAHAAAISHLVLAGNSLADAAAVDDLTTVGTRARRVKKYGYDAAAYNPVPTTFLDNILAELLPSLPVILLPGETDPANVSMPQQQLHSALLPAAKLYDGSTFTRATNPWFGAIDGVDFIVTAGQNLDDMYKYLAGDDRLAMCENMLRWRNIAPTAPDTLWSYPFQDRDPFVLEDNACPHVYVVGNQPCFDSKVVEGKDGQRVKIILVPSFQETGQIVELDLETMEAVLVGFRVMQ